MHQARNYLQQKCFVFFLSLNTSKYNPDISLKIVPPRIKEIPWIKRMWPNNCPPCCRKESWQSRWWEYPCPWHRWALDRWVHNRRCGVFWRCPRSPGSCPFRRNCPCARLHLPYYPICRTEASVRPLLLRSRVRD